MVDHLKSWSLAGGTDPYFETGIFFKHYGPKPIKSVGWALYHSTESNVSWGRCDVMRDLFCAGMSQNRWLVYQDSIPVTGRDFFPPPHAN
jgi:hypothetical protein